MTLQHEETVNCSPCEAIKDVAWQGWRVQARQLWGRFLTALLRSLAVWET
jgi:hypothetical protein